jgi:TolB protein
MAQQHTTTSMKSWLYFLAGIVLTILALTAYQQLTKPDDSLTPSNPAATEEAFGKEEVDEPTATKEIIIPTATPDQSATPLFVPVDIESEVDEDMNEVGVLAFSMMDGLHQHIFVYHPQFFPLTRLTNNLWDDVHPAFSHDGKKLAYASNQDGNWDIFILDLTTYTLTNITETESYESHPSWSPDDQWIVFESDRSGNLDLYLQPVTNLNESPLQLTLNEADEFQPVWSENGRLIAYTSLDNGNEDIWVANLDKVEDRYTNISKQP